MRAKEYLEINKNRILYYNLVKGAIEGLCPLRNNKKKTEEYFNRYLFADARYHLQPDGFKQREGEVNKNYAYDVRIYIMNAVYTDESFIFAFNIILMQKNKYYDLIPLNFCEIKEIVYFTPKVYQYFNPKVYHFKLISKSVSLLLAVPPTTGKQAFLF